MVLEVVRVVLQVVLQLLLQQLLLLQLRVLVKLPSPPGGDIFPQAVAAGLLEKTSTTGEREAQL